MRLIDIDHDTSIFHCVRDSSTEMIAGIFAGKTVIAALGPIYHQDPAASLLLPFFRCAEETGWKVNESTLAPSSIMEKAREARIKSIDLSSSAPIDELSEWTRAGLLLEICRARGINYDGHGLIHVPWRLRGTVTGRFGTEPVRLIDKSSGRPWTFNPLSLTENQRMEIVPRSSDSQIVSMDFRAMDLCSMISIVPGLAERYQGCHDGDLHARTAEILGGGISRNSAKDQIFVYAYGGRSPLAPQFERAMPQLSRFRSDTFARQVQSQSARAFRAALSRAFPLLLGERVIPLFTVHDELVLECFDSSRNLLPEISKALEDGATQRIGVPFRVNFRVGRSYEDAKGK